MNARHSWANRSCCKVGGIAYNGFTCKLLRGRKWLWGCCTQPCTNIGAARKSTAAILLRIIMRYLIVARLHKEEEVVWKDSVEVQFSSTWRHSSIIVKKHTSMRYESVVCPPLRLALRSSISRGSSVNPIRLPYLDQLLDTIVVLWSVIMKEPSTQPTWSSRPHEWQLGSSSVKKLVVHQFFASMDCFKAVASSTQQYVAIALRNPPSRAEALQFGNTRAFPTATFDYFATRDMH